MTEFAASSRIYVDTNIWIYYIEGNPQFVDAIRSLFGQIDVSGATLITSELTVAECLLKPFKDDNQDIIRLYDSLFGSGEIEMAPLNGAIAKRAAENAGKLGLKLIDAIHYVTALESGCHFFLTGDLHFRSGPQMQVIHPDV